ncbi:ACP S-malonyltransferase [Burkholderia cenocepacia]|uniref:ACP S-malonyltransferase n=1 Tax=Burkholderia cenocepacia TaxID=95486 RepID=UPI000F559C3A|nr:ACP S-malonyltransferase [Burkholderia cenocepacia]RQU33433.1 ACP S-malonyltransferase [Burkholderia cenocepacia]RQU58584.1 ACP S-malonyltransferase [Burkholderia cenocepacia]
MMALVFPGQGAQLVGMGRDFRNRYPAARAVFELADAVLSRHVSELCFEGSSDALARTRYTQAALFTTEVAIFEALKSEFMLPVAFAAGHSLGEFSALVSAGALSFEDALRLVDRRATLMAEASEGGQGLIAVSEFSAGETEAVVQELHGCGLGLDIACFNGPDQTVLAGDSAALTAASSVLEARGASIVRLNVQGAFHSRWMSPCVTPFAQTLAAACWQSLHHPVVANVTARPYPSEIHLWPALLESQLCSPVRWLQTVRFLCSQGVTHVLELGPTPVLSRLATAVLPALRTTAVCTTADVDGLGAFLAEVPEDGLRFAFLGRCLAHAAATRNEAGDAATEDFERECREPYQAVMQRYQALREQHQAITSDDMRVAVEMLRRVMEHKQVADSERYERWQELSWFDRQGLVTTSA